ncbi:hypothetical protein BDF14DRAFT_1752119 [Spinellus fusiger]|nr:hypothetical protein BDF14DRAFT_1752119 [Spinellus fusiger]
MQFLPSPPTSPRQHYLDDSVICGSCDKVLSSDWFCSDCHTKCTICNRFLSPQEHCTRCWTFSTLKNHYIRKHNHQPSHNSYCSHAYMSGFTTDIHHSSSNIKHDPRYATSS